MTYRIIGTGQLAAPSPGSSTRSPGDDRKYHQDRNDPNKVIVIDRYPDMATMELYLANPQPKEAVTQAGVTAPPAVLIGLAT